jgi:hypothetical protein
MNDMDVLTAVLSGVGVLTVFAGGIMDTSRKIPQSVANVTVGLGCTFILASIFLTTIVSQIMG